MKRFVKLYQQLDETKKTGRKIDALKSYFAEVSPAEGAWAVYFLCGRRLKRLILSRNLQAWCCEAAGVPAWLFEECRETVGDMAESMALLLNPAESAPEVSLDRWMTEVLLPLRELAEPEQRTLLLESWSRLTANERLVFNKLVTGEFRIGVSQGLVVRALAESSGLTAQAIAHRLMGTWEPTAEFYSALVSTEGTDTDVSKPFPFCLAHPLKEEPQTLGAPREWLVEWKWDGIRAQVIRRGDESFVWSRGEELITERFPEVTAQINKFPNGTVLDGELVGWKEDRVLPFGDLQQRIGRKKLTQKMLNDVPVRYLVFDVLEHAGTDLRSRPLAERRELLEKLPALAEVQQIAISPRIAVASWEEVQSLRLTSRERGVEGFMLKKLDSEYAGGRVTGLWWKWKVDPYSCDAVLIYAQRGHGRRASLYTDYTFGVWDQGELIPVAKAYSGLTDEEIQEVDRFVRRNTLEKFGPVHSVKPELVFELAFDGIQLSSRHKSGVAVRFPRMARWRRDKQPKDADTLDSLKALMGPQ